MKDSKEKEHRISNLKDMIHNIKEDDGSDEYVEDSELIDYLNQDSEDDELEIDDEYIYRPGDDDDYAVNLEENPIDEDFLIKTPAEKEISDEKEDEEFEEIPEDIMGDVSESFDNIVHAKIGRTPILGIVSTILGLIFIVISVFIFQSRSDRVIDHVVAGETNFIFIIVLVIGLALFIYGIFKVFHIKSPLKSLTDSIDSIDLENKEKDTSDDAEEKPTPKVIPKSNIPLDKESYKIGEFEMEDLKNKLKKPTSSDPKPKPSKKNLDDIPIAEEKTEEEMTSEKIEEIDYEQEKLENESIDDIFAEIEEIDEIPIISIDSEEKQQ